MHPTISLFNTKIYIFPFILLAAVFTCLFVYLGNTSKYHIGYLNVVMKSLIAILVSAAIFGKLFSTLIFVRTSNTSFIEALLNGGFIFYGGVLGGVIGGFVYCKIRRLSVFDLSDVVFSLLPIGQTIGRIGCYMNGCCYGREHIGFPSVLYVVDGIEKLVFPTWFFESFFCMILALYFQLIYRTTKRGFHSAVYLITYSSFRFVIEFYRGDEIRGVYGWISTSQIISIVFFVFGIFLMIYSHIKSEENFMLK